MKLKFDVQREQADPFIFQDGDKFYLYVTGDEGVEAYSSDDVFGLWHYEGVVFRMPGCCYFWAPSVVKVDGTYYVYVSCDKGDAFENMYVAKSDSPLGQFSDPKHLFDRFTIDSHVVETDKGLYLFYAEDNVNCERVGTRVFVDKLKDPYTPMNLRKEIIVPSMDEEIFRRNRFGDGKDWHTIEGPFWFREDGWQYVMYSGACYENDTYHIGYASAKSGNQELTEVSFEKHTKNGAFDPVLFKNEFEEGVGHHSVIKLDGQYYAVYHGRDVEKGSYEGRTARICKLIVNNGIITAERF